MNHKDFTVKELKEDASFRRMVKGIASAEEVQYWNQWIESRQENRIKAKKALSNILGFEFDTLDVPDIEEEWRRLRKRTNDKSIRNSSLRLSNKRGKLKWYFLTAAVLLLIGLSGVGLYFFNNDDSVPQLEQVTGEKTINTGQSEQKTLQFSNGSKIILNSNSSLSYRPGIENNSTIEITLNGEAWFDADSNSASDQPVFAVATPDGIIRDIGTKFLVRVENGFSRIVLQEGVVEVEPLRQVEMNSELENRTFQVQKGEMVEFRGTDIVSRKNVNPSFYSSWATGVLELAESSVVEFAAYVEGRFDIEVILRDPGLKDIRLNGTVYFRSLDELMRSVSEVIGIPVYRSENRDTVYIGNSN